MDVSLLLNSFSSFDSLSASNALKTELVQTYYLQIKEYLELLNPIFDGADFSEITAMGNLDSTVKYLVTSLKVARELIENWHQMTSKLHFVIQIDSAINKLQASALETCQLLVSSFTEDSVSKLVENCMQKCQIIHNEQTSLVITEAIKAQAAKENPSSANLDNITRSLSLSSNQELLLETLALEKLKAILTRSENHADIELINQLITLINYMNYCHVKENRLHSINGVPIPDDFCCPLSLELMTDPVIVESGQTYERAFIKQWLDQGFNVCPKTRQTLAHNNLIPNYTVKALIANWCDSNDIKLPHPKKFFPNTPSVLLNSQDSHSIQSQNINRPKSPDISNIGPKSSDSINHDTHKLEKEATSPLHPNSTGSPLRISNGSLVNHESTSKECNDPSSRQLDLPSSSIAENQFQGHNRSNSTSNAVANNGHTQREGDENNISQVSSDLTNNNSSDNSGEVTQEASVVSSRLRELIISPRLSETRSRRQTSWRHPSERFVPRIISPSTESRPDLSGIEAEARKLVEDLKSDSIEIQRDATAAFRFLARHNMDNRIVIANCGAISLLVGLLLSTNMEIQENAVTALMNLSINDNNKTAIANADCIDPLIHVLETGNAEAKENAAATLYSLSVIEENKARIGRSRAIKPLVELLGNGTPGGKKDATTALFNLSIFNENKARIVSAGAVKYLVKLMDPAAGMVDKAVAVLANLATIPEGRTAIGHEGGIPVLVVVVELGSAMGKEKAAAALLYLCTNSSRFCSQVLQEGAVPPLVALSQSGTARAKEKVHHLYK